MSGNFTNTAVKKGLFCFIKSRVTGMWQMGIGSDTCEYTERVDFGTGYIL